MTGPARRPRLTRSANPEGLGPPWVLMSCPLTSNLSGPGDVELYSLTDGTRQTVTASPGLPPQCPQSDVETECAFAGAVGAYWLRWDASLLQLRSQLLLPEHPDG